jgi:Na+-driven multidrug efflux pump
VTTEPPSPHSQFGSFQPQPHPRNDLGIAALVVGILALVFCWFPFAGIVFGVATVALAIAGRRRIKRGEADNRRTTMIGMVLGTVAFVVGGAVSVVVLLVFIDYQSCIDHARSRAEYGQC